MTTNKITPEELWARQQISPLDVDLAMKRCERKKCGDREPQNGY